MERDPDLEHRARDEGDQDLRDGEAEVEDGLAENLERHDHGGELQSRVPHGRQQHRVGRAAEADRGAIGGERGRGHRAQNSSNAAGSDGSASTSVTEPRSSRKSST